MPLLCRRSAVKPHQGRLSTFCQKSETRKNPGRGKSRPDEYGFSVDPRVAKELRDSKLQLASLTIGRRMRPYTFAQKVRKLQARIKEIRQSLQCPCPSKYQLKHLQGDKERLEILAGRRAKGLDEAEETKMLGTILIIILILLLIGALPTWGYSSGWGYYPAGRSVSF